MKILVRFFVAGALFAFAHAGQAALLGLWRFDGDANDSSGRGNHGSLVNGAALSDDVPGGLAGGQSLSLAGGTQHVLVPDSRSLDVTGTISIAAWIKPVGNVGWDAVIGKTPSNGSLANHAGNYEFRIDNGTRALHFLYQRGGVDDSFFHPAAGAFATEGAWQHIAVTAEAGGDVNFYINGSLVETHATLTDAAFGATNTNPLYIGSRADLFTTLDGLLDDVAVFNEVLSVDQIGTLMSGDYSAFIIPEPSTALLGLAGGLVLLLGVRRRRMA